MTGDATNELRVVERAGPARRVVLRAATGTDADLWVLGGYEGPKLPDALGLPRIESRGNGNYRLESDRGNLEFTARAIDRIAMRPSLFDALHRPFALGARDRFVARALLALLRLPGGARLLRFWHARQTR